MTWENSAITITTLLPIVGALVIAVMPKEKDRTIRLLGILITGAALVLAVAIALGFDLHREGLQFVLDVEWIPIIGARYHVGIDGISLPLYVLTFLLSFLCAIYTWRYVPNPGRTKAFLALMLQKRRIESAQSAGDHVGRTLLQRCSKVSRVAL